MTNESIPQHVREALVNLLELAEFDTAKITRLHIMSLGISSSFLGADVAVWMNSVSKQEADRVFNRLTKIVTGGE